ncbi:MAG: translation initiation factor IF-6 [Candidatus Hodarchaeota archaeon]
MEIEFTDFLGSVHIGVSMFCTESVAFLPINAPSHLKDLIQKLMQVEITLVSDNIIGSLVVGNSYGCVVSSVITDEVLNQIKSAGLTIYQAPEFFAFGNVVLVNDFSGIISPIIPPQIRREISETLNVPLEPKTLAQSDLVGSLAYITNYGGLFSPLTSEEEINDLKDILHLNEAGVGSVNKGSEFVASGIVGNTKGILVGRETTGIEIMEITRCFYQ